MLPGSSETSWRVASVILTSTPAMCAFLKFAADISSRYLPGDSSVTEKVPSSPVVSVRTDLPVASLTTSTVAPETTAPFLSVTTPEMPPVWIACADAATQTSPNRNTLVTKRTTSRIEAYPPSTLENLILLWGYAQGLGSNLPRGKQCSALDDRRSVRDLGAQVE